MFLFGTKNGKDCESYGGTKFRKQFGDWTSLTEGCNHDASWIGAGDLELMLLISGAVDLKDACMVITLKSKLV